MLWIKIWIEFRGRLLTYLLVGGSGPKVVHACNFYFYFFGMSTRHAYLKLRKYGDSSHVFQRTKRSGSWLMFLEDGGIFFFFLGFDSCFQRTKGFGSWLMFSED